MSRSPVRLGVLLSGRGSNFIAISDAIRAGEIAGCQIAVVLANLADAPGLEAARDRGLPAVAQLSRGVPREQHDAAMLEHLRSHAVDLVVLAGYMRVLTPAFIGAYRGRILNIHPSLLPAFPGLHAQRQALLAGVKIAGCTVHLVDEQVDHGTILLQRSVPVLDGDTEATLSARILVEEHKAYPEALRQILGSRYGVEQESFDAQIAPGGDATSDVLRLVEQLELSLLSSAVRRDAARSGALLARGFREFGSSGRSFSREQTLDLLQQEEEREPPSVIDFAARLVETNSVLVTYRAVRVSADGSETATNRSSLWVHEEGAWRILFHQGTPVSV